MAVSTRKKYTSKKIHSSGISSSLLRAARAEKTVAEKMVNLVNSWKKLQNPWVTIANPDRNVTNKPFIKVRAEHLWGDPRPKKNDDKPAQSHA